MAPAPISHYENTLLLTLGIYPMEQVKVAFTIPEFCNLYGVGRSFTYDEISAGRLQIRKAGKKTLILRVDADAWLHALPKGDAA